MLPTGLPMATNDSDKPFWDAFWAAALQIAIALAIILVAWFVLRLVIVWAARGIERGADISERQAKRLSKYGKTPPPRDYEKDLELEKLRRYKRAKTIRAVAISAASVLAILTGVFVVLSILGVPIAALLASAGILSVALGFGAQSLVKDLISGVFMLLEDQYGVGDIIDVGEAMGTVEERRGSSNV